MKARGILIEVARILLGLTFVASALLKGIDPVGVGLKVHEFQTLVFGISHPKLLAYSEWMGYILIITEFVCGAFLLMGIYRRLASRLSFAIMLFFTVLTAYTYVTGVMPDCGCFGDIIKLSPLETLAKNLLLLPVSLLLMVYPLEIKHLYSKREQWFPAVLAVLGIGVFVYLNARALPAIDFLPYKVGYNIRERIAEVDAKYQEELNLHTRYIYERDGKEQSFAVDSLPTDSTWHFVRISQPEELSLKQLDYSLLILNPDGEDKTSEILHDTTGVFLFVSPDWKQAQQTKYEVINELYHYLKERGIKFYSISSTLANNEAEWRYQTGAEYPSLFADATTIKSMIRSNPGMVIMQDGKIIDKLSSKDFPQSDEIANFVSSRLVEHQHTSPSPARASLLYAWAVLLLVGASRRLTRLGRASLYLREQSASQEKE